MYLFNRILGPAVRNLCDKYGLNLSAIKINGSGPRGLILKGDVLNHIQKENLTPVPSTSAFSNFLLKIV